MAMRVYETPQSVNGLEANDMGLRRLRGLLWLFGWSVLKCDVKNALAIEGGIMKAARFFFSLTCLLLFGHCLRAQDLGPHFKKVADGIFVESASEASSNCGIILTNAGVVLIDSGYRSSDAQEVSAAVKKLTPLPILFLVDSENHPDHTTNHWVFSPPAVIIAGQGTSEAMRKAFDSPDFLTRSGMTREGLTNYQLITPQVEYHEKMTLNVGERTFELLNLKNVHSETDTAIWLPHERVLFAASAAVPKTFDNIRPFVTIPDKLNAFKMMKALNPEIVISGHGSPGTTKIFDEAEQYYALLVQRVSKMIQEGKSDGQIKQELRMPEYDDWAAQDRLPTNIDAAYRAVKAGYSPDK
jgi:cyclase